MDAIGRQLLSASFFQNHGQQITYFYVMPF